jgi:phosphohistidine phosphatase
MLLYIMRHGEAQNHAISDELRELTINGLSEVRSIAKQLSHEKFDLVIVSPYVRAQQTAKMMIKMNDGNAEVLSSDLITPLGSANDVHHFLDGLFAEKQYEKVLIVSHMPLVSYLIAELSTDNQMPIFQTAAALKIEYSIEKMKGSVIEMLCPFSICHTD